MKSKILVIVEGAKTDLRLMHKLFEIYGINESHEIVPYRTNIYTLYNRMFSGGEPEAMDIQQVLKEQEKDETYRQLLDESYSDTLIIFDLDPQAPDYRAEKIREMADYFTESSDMGKLYINYPMVESFYHMKSIPDLNYNSRMIALTDIPCYKTLVNKENRNGDYSKFAVDRNECNTVILQNIEKGWLIIKGSAHNDDVVPNTINILNNQLNCMQSFCSLYVLCTCVYYIAEYNTKLLQNQPS